MMQNQISIPMAVMFSMLVGCFLLGAIAGTTITYFLLGYPRDIAIHPIGSSQSTIPKSIFLRDQKAFVKEVVDGDTIEVDWNGQMITIRYLGIDAPENKGDSMPSYFAIEALARNKALVEKKWITLKWDQELEEQRHFSGNRLLAYVYVEDIFVNAELLKYGYAMIYRRQAKPLALVQSQQFEALEQEARTNQRGIWNQQAKEQWEQAAGLRSADHPDHYIADETYFHRPGCMMIKETAVKLFYRHREQTLRDGKQTCPVCKP